MKKGLVLVVFLILLVPTLAHGQVFGNIHRFFFPQIAYGGGWITTIIATNVSDRPAQFTIGFTAPGGNALSVPIVDRSGSVRMVNGYNPSDIPPRSSWTNTLRSSEPTVTVGSMVAHVNIVDSRDTIRIQVTYSYIPNGTIESQASVLATEPARILSFQVVRPDAGADIGIAISNPNYAVAGVNVRVYSMAGAEVASMNFNIPANGQTAKFITELVPELKTTWNGGLIVIASDQDVAAVGLLTTSGGERFTIATASVLAN